MIYKYELPKRNNLIQVPGGAKSLTVQMQRGQIVLWCLVDSFQALVNRRYTVYMTGEPGVEGSYVGTVQEDNGLVCHVFETYNG